MSKKIGLLNKDEMKRPNCKRPVAELWPWTTKLKMLKLAKIANILAIAMQSMDQKPVSSKDHVYFLL